jgi:hypothetical protein
MKTNLSRTKSVLTAAMFHAATAFLLGIMPQITVAETCASWPDSHKACVSCPTGYLAGCTIPEKSATCNCYCDIDVNALAANLAKKDENLQAYILNNLDHIISKTQQDGYFKTDSGTIISIEP